MTLPLVRTMPAVFTTVLSLIVPLVIALPETLPAVAIVASLLATRTDSAQRRAYVLAALNIAMADAAIAATDVKYAYWYWRPITAIRAGVHDFPRQPNWRPLIPTPNHPSFPSGHATFSASAVIVIDALLGKLPFTTNSLAKGTAPRSFADADDAAREAANSRLWGGIHYRADNDEGLALGYDVGRWALKSFQEKVGPLP